MREIVNMCIKMVFEGYLVNGFDLDVKFQYFYKEFCFYSYQIFINVSKIFFMLKYESLEERENFYFRKKNKIGLVEKV